MTHHRLNNQTILIIKCLLIIYSNIYIMKTKINEKGHLNINLNSSFKPHGYYFHPDEDFREDWQWGKTQQAEEQPLHYSQIKKSIEKFK